MKDSSNTKLRVGMALIVAIVLALILLPIKEYLTQFLEWVQGIGPAGLVVFGIVYILACIFAFPASILTLGAGFAFGLLAGTITVSLSSILGASAAFLLGRTLARDFVSKKVKSNPKFNAIDEAVGREGFKIVFLTRLSPAFPFNLQNYMYGLTKVSFWNHFFASWIAMLPGTFMYVYLGAAVKNIADIAAGHVEGGSGQKILLWVGLAATVVVTVYVTRIAKKALREAAPDAE